jgi:hypothetical protein
MTNATKMKSQRDRAWRLGVCSFLCGLLPALPIVALAATAEPPETVDVALATTREDLQLYWE